MPETCPLCAFREFKPAKHGLLRCLHCQLVFDRRVWDSAANVANEEEWFENKPISTFWHRLFKSWNNDRTWANLKKRIPLSGRVLEIGVGDGSLLAFLKNKGYEVAGCDLSRSLCEYVKELYGFPMYNQPIEAMPSGAKYDVAIMSHVLEHVNSPIAFLREVRERMKDGAIAYIGVPNIAAWEASLPGWNSYEPYHLCYFSPSTLRAVIAKAGFEILDIKTHESFSGWFLALLRTALKTREKSSQEREIRRQETGPTWIGHAYRLAMVLSGVVSLPLRYVQDVMGRGDEIIVIAMPTENR